jgi:hypothetical protein
MDDDIDVTVRLALKSNVAGVTGGLRVIVANNRCVVARLDRIASQLGHIQQHLEGADANYEQARATLAECLDLTRDRHTAYLEANDNTRRLFNQAFFAKIYIDEEDETRERTVRVDYNQPFDDLLSRLVPAHTPQD